MRDRAEEAGLDEAVDRRDGARLDEIRECARAGGPCDVFVLAESRECGLCGGW